MNFFYSAAVVLGLSASIASATSSQHVIPDELVQDAQLNSVCFIDTNLGWAVGDRGVIWNTQDGGKHWTRQTSPVSCRLESVLFLTRDVGWAVGGFVQQYNHHSTGVVLGTQDGGIRWTRVEQMVLPRLLDIRMLDAQQGWAVGYRSLLNPNGVLRTEDGGRTWIPLPGRGDQVWLAGDFTNLSFGIVAGLRGEIGVVRRNGIQRSRTPSLGLINVWKLRFANRTRGWLVGDGGLLMNTEDGGVSWESGDTLPQDVADQIDFRAVAPLDDQCWVAGAPGSVVLRTTDDGTTWQVFRTGQNMPIRDLTFVDSQNGWAVGDLGTILASRDGGQTWQRQKSGGTRAALMALFAEPDNVPWELFARLSADEGYLGIVETLNRRDLEVTRSMTNRISARVHDAAVHVGGSAAYTTCNFPLRMTGLQLPEQSILEIWNRANDGQGVNRLEEHVVRRIRQWRPDVVVTHSANLNSDSNVSRIVHQIVLASVEKAADATSYSEQTTRLGLSAWKVKKIFSALDDEQQGTVNILSSRVSATSGIVFGELASVADGLVTEDYQPPNNVIGFRLLSTEVPEDLARRDFFSGISLPPGGEARRVHVTNTSLNLASLRHSAQKRRNIQKILEQSEQAQSSGGGWFGQISDLTRGLDSRSAGGIMMHLAQRYAQTGRQDMAAEVLQTFVTNHPKHALVGIAYRWLVYYYTSAEAAHRNRKSQPKDSRADGDSYWNKVLAFAKDVERNNPLLFSEPEFRFPLTIAYRESGMPREAERYFDHLMSSRIDSPWARCARAEQWLSHARGQPPKSVAHCQFVSEKPYLDGEFKEPIWQNAEQLELVSVHGDDDKWPASVAIAYDHEYVYVGIRCRTKEDSESPVSDEARVRDADLRKHDRVELLFDVNRDYASFYRLTVDHRGWTRDVCLGDIQWNPQWYVAAAQIKSGWQIEMAVPLEELVSNSPQRGTVWAIGLQRIIPHLGFQSWTQPANVDIISESFGLLLFQ